MYHPIILLQLHLPYIFIAVSMAAIFEGVAQGSQLGPLLFPLFLFNLLKLVFCKQMFNCMFIMFKYLTGAIKLRGELDLQIGVKLFYYG